MSRNTKRVSKPPAAKLPEAVQQELPASSKPGQDMLTMDEAIAALKTTRPTFYRWLREGKVKGMKVGRQWRFQRQDIERFVQGLEPRVDLPVSIRPLIDQLDAKLSALGHHIRVGNEDTVSTAVNAVLILGYHQRASDIHLAPHYDGKDWSLMVRNRIDGVLHVVAQADIRLLPALAERIRSMAALHQADKRLPQDGRIEILLNGEQLDLRVAIVPATMGESLTLRVLRRDALKFGLADMGYDSQDLKRLQEAVHSPFGLIVCNGPTGTGKTTTLYGCLSELAGPQIKCMAVEDPVEFILPWVTQVQVNEQAGLTFSRAMRAFLRSGTNVILLGEIRDREALELCLQASLTGHLVFTSLHAQDCPSALHHMVEIGAPAFLVGDATRLIVSQRLVRRLCPHCSKPAKLSAEEEALVAQVSASGGLALAEMPRDFRQATGCAKCGQLGYRGQIVVAEVMKISFALARALRDRASVDELRRLAVAEGMSTMQADGIRKAAAGITTLAEVQRVRN